MKNLIPVFAAGLAIAAGVASPVFGQSRTRGVAPAVTSLAYEQGLGDVSGDVVGSGKETNDRDTAVAFWLHVLHTNDGESRVRPINSGTPAVGPYGGAAFFKTRSDQLKAFAQTFPAGTTPKGSVLISSGDNFLAGAEFNASLLLPPSQPFYDAVALQLIDFDAITPGNHDFDFAPDVFARFVSSFTDGTPFVTANLDFAGVPSVQALVNQGRVRRSVVINVADSNGGTQQVGIIGATTTLLPFISSPIGVIVNPLLPVIQQEVDGLTAQGVKIIILSSHLQSLSQEISLVPLLRDVDIVIGGGGSEIIANPGTLLVPGQTANTTNFNGTGTGYPRVAFDSQGKSVPVVTTFGEYRYIGRLVGGFNAAGELVQIDPISDVVRVSGRAGDPDAVIADPAVQAAVVNPVNASVAALAANVIGTTNVALDGTRTSVRTRETNLGNLLADSILWTAGVAAPAGSPVPDIALQNGGGIRNTTVIPAGNLSELNTFDTAPFANFVTIVPSVSPAQLKTILENAVSRVAQTDGRFAQISGFRLVWDASRPALTYNAAGTTIMTPGERVRDVVLDDGRVVVANGQVVPGAPSVNIATINFLFGGGDQYPINFAGFSNTLITTGVSYQQALFNFIVGPLNGRVTGFDYPASGQGRITRLN